LSAGAIAAFEGALKLLPGHPGLLINLGVQFDTAGHPDRAERCYREVLQRRPNELAALTNLAQLLFGQERLAEALPVYDRIVAVAPQAPAEIWNNRGVCQRRVRDSGAEASFRHALSLKPDSPQVLANLGFLLCEQRCFDDARPLLERARSLDPSRLQVAAQLLDLDLQFADWSDFEGKRSAVIAGVERLGSERGQTVPPFAFLSICDDPALQLKAAMSFAWPPIHAQPSPVTVRLPLRVGFAATAFHDHPVPRVIVDLLERLDRNRFETFAYALGPDTPDALRQRISRAVRSLADLGSMGTEQATARIRGDGIQILFDLTGHTEQARAEVFAARPAPIQINFVGYAGTLGAAYYDYIVTDATTTPESERIHFTEKLALIEGCYLPSDSRRAPLGPLPSRADYGLAADAFVFCAQSAPYKILPEMFDIWMRLLRQTDSSLLWLREVAPAAQRNLRGEASRRGIAAERLLFAPREQTERYLARFALADLYLDTYPFGAHTTVNDALFSGLPVLTLAGRSMAARASASQLSAVRLDELIATSHAQYEEIALRLVRDRSYLEGLTARLKGERHSSLLFDMPAYTRRFEDMLERMAQALRR